MDIERWPGGAIGRSRMSALGDLLWVVSNARDARADFDAQVAETFALLDAALKEGGSTPADRIEYAFRLVTSRRPNSREMEVLKKLYGEQKELFLANPKGAEDLARVGQTASDAKLDRAELAASTALAGALLNLDDFIMKR